jgi:hypothetical protein
LSGTSLKSALDGGWNTLPGQQYHFTNPPQHHQSESSLVALLAILLTVVHSRAPKSITDLVHDIELFKNKFETLVNHLPRLFLAQNYAMFLQALRIGSFETATTQLDVHIAAFEDLHSQIMSCGDTILTLARHGREFEYLQSVADRVHHVVECLQDLWCNGSEGAASLESCYECRGLLFQGEV